MKFPPLLLIGIFWTLFFTTQAQERFTVSGKLVDAETNAPLPFASIGIKGKSLGTVSNLQGEFDFHFPQSYKDEELTISILGYVDISREIQALMKYDSIIIFRMAKAVQMLDEVIVQDSLAAEEIIRIALNKIAVNHPSEPYMMEGFYRDLKKIGGTYFSILEAAVKIYDEDYEEPRNKYRLRERVSLMEVRKSIGYDNKFTRFFDQTNLLEDLLLHNPVKYRHFPDDKAFFASLRRLPNSFYKGHQVYVIRQIRGPKLKIYIDTETFAFIRIENDIAYEDLVLKKSKDLYSLFDSKSLILDFTTYEGKVYPSYMKVISRISWYDANTDVLKFKTELYQELLINKVEPNPKDKISSFDKMRKYGLQYQDLPYNKSFWNNYNVIKQTPLDREIIADLERQGALPEGVDSH